MTSILNLFFYLPISSSPMIIVDGSSYCVVGSRTITLTSSTTLSFVLSLQKLAFNLIYVTYLTHELNYSILFFLDHCLLQDLMTWQIISKEHVFEVFILWIINCCNLFLVLVFSLCLKSIVDWVVLSYIEEVVFKY